MALHGTIQINEHTLYEWSARCLVHRTSGTNPYEVKLWAGRAGPFWDEAPLAETQIDHTYEHGAIELAGKVLDWAKGWTKARANVS